MPLVQVSVTPDTLLTGVWDQMLVGASRRAGQSLLRGRLADVAGRPRIRVKALFAIVQVPALLVFATAFIEVAADLTPLAREVIGGQGSGCRLPECDELGIRHWAGRASVCLTETMLAVRDGLGSARQCLIVEARITG